MPRMVLMDNVLRFKRFMKELSECIIFYHSDADGLCAAITFSKAMEKLGKEPCRAIALESYEIAKAKELSSGAKHLIFLDLSADAETHVIKLLEKKANVLIIDHHKIYKDLNSKKTILIKPQMLSTIEPSSYAASKLCFDLCSGIVNMSEYSWIPSIGIIGDFGYAKWQSFVDEAAKKANISVEEMKEIASLIDAVKILAPERFAELFELFMLSDPKHILKHELNALREKLQRQLMHWKKEFYKSAEHFPEIELYFFHMKPSASIKSALIDIITKELPNKTVVIAEDLGESTIKFSARRQDFRVAMNELLENAVRGIPNASAGGHVPAAAGSVPREYFLNFKKNLLEQLKERYKQTR